MLVFETIAAIWGHGMKRTKSLNASRNGTSEPTERSRRKFSTSYITCKYFAIKTMICGDAICCMNKTKTLAKKF